MLPTDVTLMTKLGLKITFFCRGLGCPYECRGSVPQLSGSII